MLKAILVAASLNPTAPVEKDQGRCFLIGDLAQSIMEARQQGVALSDMMSIAEGNEGFIALVLQAYSQPRYSTESIQQEVIRDFRNTIEVICYEQI